MLLLALGAVVCTTSTACSRYIDPNVPEPIRPAQDPRLGRKYLLYQPSSYNRDFTWPLVVVCHGAFPDSPNGRIRAWTELAEQYGFFVVAPTLQSASADWLASAEMRRRKVRRDVEHILATVQHIRAGHNISRERIFIHGWAEGTMAALQAGLGHPERFRAVAVARPRFDADEVSGLEHTLDHYQPILVNYPLADTLIGQHGKRLVEWLRARGANVTQDPEGATVEGIAARTVTFFLNVLRHQPWIRIRGFPAATENPLDIQFKVATSEPHLTQFRWDFGDGSTATEAEPVHTFPAAGTYRIVLKVRTAGGEEYRRAVTLRLPEAALANAAPEPSENNADPPARSGERPDSGNTVDNGNGAD